MSTLSERLFVILNPRRASEDNAAKAFEEKRKLFSIHELNEKFIRNNVYYICVVIVLYVGIGIAIYHGIMKWDRLNSFYFVVQTLLTVGYGDYVPASEHERVFTAFYIIIGIAVCSSALGAVSTMMQSHQERTDKLRNMRALLRMKEEEEHDSGLSGREDGDPRGFSLQELSHAYSAETAANTASNAATTAPPIEGDLSRVPSIVPTSRATSRAISTASAKRRASILDNVMSLSISLSTDKPRKKSLKELREAALSAFEEDYNQLMRATVFDFIGMFLVLIFGMVVMSLIENWSSSEAFYWATVTIFTVGYGDVTPTSSGGKIFFIIYALAGCALMAKILTDIIKYPLLARVLQHEEEVAKQFMGATASPEFLETIFDNELHKLIPDLKRVSEEMTKSEFVLLILHLLNKVEEKDIFLAAKLFDDLDADTVGVLRREEVQQKVQDAIQKRERESILQRNASGEGGSIVDGGSATAAGGAQSGSLRLGSWLLQHGSFSRGSFTQGGGAESDAQTGNRPRLGSWLSPLNRQREKERGDAATTATMDSPYHKFEDVEEGTTRTTRRPGQVTRAGSAPIAVAHSADAATSPLQQTLMSRGRGAGGGGGEGQRAVASYSPPSQAPFPASSSSPRSLSPQPILRASQHTDTTAAAPVVPKRRKSALSAIFGQMEEVGAETEAEAKVQTETASALVHGDQQSTTETTTEPWDGVI